MGILESYHALIDLLAARYAYTDLRGLDWSTIRATWLPRVEAADAADDLTAYYAAISALALRSGMHMSGPTRRMPPQRSGLCRRSGCPSPPVLVPAGKSCPTVAS